MSRSLTVKLWTISLSTLSQKGTIVKFRSSRGRRKTKIPVALAKASLAEFVKENALSRHRSGIIVATCLTLRVDVIVRLRTIIAPLEKSLSPRPVRDVEGGIHAVIISGRIKALSHQQLPRLFLGREEVRLDSRPPERAIPEWKHAPGCNFPFWPRPNLVPGISKNWKIWERKARYGALDVKSRYTSSLKCLHIHSLRAKPRTSTTHLSNHLAAPRNNYTNLISYIRMMPSLNTLFWYLWLCKIPRSPVPTTMFKAKESK